MDRERLTREVLRRCEAAGFAAAGVASIEPSAFAAEFRAWLDAGKHSTMSFLEEHAELRVEPARMLEGAKAAIVVADQYAERGGSDAARAEMDDGEMGVRAFGRVARYAQGRDYHKVMKKRLHGIADALREEIPGCEFRTVVDTAPVFERELAKRAGLGWIGKHTLLIHPRRGSWLLLGVVFTTLDLVPTGVDAREPDHCGTCTRCIDACPTQAITPYSVDASRCVTYLTVERQEAIPAGLHAGVGEWLYGCDVCQEVCPHNSARGAGFDASFGAGKAQPAYAARFAGFDATGVLAWDDEARKASTAGTPMTWAALAMLKRNALVVVTNAVLRETKENGAARAAWAERLRTIAGDAREDGVVRETAGQSLARLGISGA
ncbi:MAG: tRNA epoxyqueuosine(34) reductase QueG [Phycisphaerales bacterium]|jgi:epoxyqueuosine reductase|nr:tRNA epoxyqueuosine(34) reductase QueG [Phycisphaerales bacterium]